MRPAFVAIVVAFVVWLVVAVRTGAGDPTPTTTASGPEPPPAPPPQVVTVERKVQGRDARQWHRVAVRYLSTTRDLQRTLLHQPDVAEAINLSCVVYGNCQTLWRKARCESHLYRFAQNSSSGAAGLFQFLLSTWRSTPFARFSPFSAIANALAAGWMHATGRGGEWVCR